VVTTAEDGGEKKQGRRSGTIEERARESRRRVIVGAVLTIVLLLCLSLAVWLYPTPSEVVRPRPLSLQLSAFFPVTLATDYVQVVPDSTGYSTGGLAGQSEVDIDVVPMSADIDTVTVTWTYLPGICSPTTATPGCANPGQELDSQMLLTLPPGAVPVACHNCSVTSATELDGTDPRCPYEGTLGRLPCGGQAAIQAQTSTTTSIQPTLPDVNDAGPRELSHVRARWVMRVRASSLAWDENGVTAESTLPALSFQDVGDVGYGSLEAHYDVPGGSSYNWTDGPPPSGLTWSESIDSATVPVDVTGSDDAVSQRDTLDTLICGALLGIAGGALVGALQELLHADLASLRRRARRSPPS
jgi:hypothetical protein